MTVVVLSALDLCKITSDPQHFLELISQALPHLLTDSLEKKNSPTTIGECYSFSHYCKFLHAKSPKELSL